jgi:phosphoenolpyruvate-protein kinase (PTS system EI component)
MTASNIPAVKARIRAMSMADARELARRALACEDAESVRRLAVPRGSVA